jgi:uncharacterized protein with GYD domain
LRLPMRGHTLPAVPGRPARPGKEAAMATFVSLVHWTEQGVKAFRESGTRADAFASLVEKRGGTVKGMYWTLGEYDLVVITELPDAETVTATLLELGALGNVRTTTLQAFDRAGFERIVEKTG